MKKLFLLLLLLPFAASAEHHRGHALGFIDTIDVNIAIMESKTSQYVAAAAAAGCVFTDSEQQSIDVLFRYGKAVHDHQQIVRDILNDPLGNLDDARRKMNQPNGDNPVSVAVLINGLMHRHRSLAQVCPAGDFYLNQVEQRLTIAWTNVDRAIWHITDAIREEVYADPEFICSGPNNHCE